MCVFKNQIMMIYAIKGHLPGKLNQRAIFEYSRKGANKEHNILRLLIGQNKQRI